MPKDQSEKPEQPAQDICNDLLEQTLSLQLATLGETGYPHCGYTPYLMQDDGAAGARNFYVFVSELALHTRDLLHNPKASILIIEDESKAKQVFARTRVYYECDAEEITRENKAHTELLDNYENRHGKTVTLLRQLPDFRLFKLTPRSGQFVMGFGQAYQLTGEDLKSFEHSRRA